MFNTIDPLSWGDVVSIYLLIEAVLLCLCMLYLHGRLHASTRVLVEASSFHDILSPKLISYFSNCGGDCHLLLPLTHALIIIVYITT